MVGLGSSCEVGGDVGVPFLGGVGSIRGLLLGWRYDVWSAYYRFLGVRVDSKIEKLIAAVEWLEWFMDETVREGAKMVELNEVLTLIKEHNQK